MRNVRHVSSAHKGTKIGRSRQDYQYVRLNYNDIVTVLTEIVDLQFVIGYRKFIVAFLYYQRCLKAERLTQKCCCLSSCPNTVIYTKSSESPGFSLGL